MYVQACADWALIETIEPKPKAKIEKPIIKRRLLKSRLEVSWLDYSVVMILFFILFPLICIPPTYLLRRQVVLP